MGTSFLLRELDPSELAPFDNKNVSNSTSKIWANDEICAQFKIYNFKK